MACNLNLVMTHGKPIDSHLELARTVSDAVLFDKRSEGCEDRTFSVICLLAPMSLDISVSFPTVCVLSLIGIKRLPTCNTVVLTKHP